MSYGFDPRIILAGQQPDSDGMARTFADMSRLGIQQQQHQATMGDMLRKQQQEQSLADILRQNANNPEAIGPALMSAGLGSAALDWTGRHADVGYKNAQKQGAEVDFLRKQGELMARPLVQNGIPRNQQELDQLRAAWKSMGYGLDSMRGTEQFNEQTEHVLKQMRALGTPTAPHLSEAGEDARAARAEYERAKAEQLRRGPSSGDPAKTENLRLRNEKLRKELGTEAPAFKESDIRSWSSQVPGGTRNIFTEVGKAKDIADSVGGIEKLAGVGLIGGKAPPQLLPKKEQQFRQHAAAAANAYRKIFAGAAVSPEEGAQINKAIAMVESGKTANEVATGLMILEGFAEDSLEQALAGAAPAIKEKVIRDIRPARKKGGGQTVPAGSAGPQPSRGGISAEELEELRLLEGKYGGGQ
jgi:hypothetical protein